MNTRTTFRLLLSGTVLAPILGAIATAFPGNISEEWRNVLLWNGNHSFFELLEQKMLLSETGSIVLLALLAIAIITPIFVIYIGLFRFRRFARTANIWFTGLCLFCSPWLGLVVAVPLESALYYLGDLCEGAVIALSYSSPLKELFENNGNRQPAIKEQEIFSEIPDTGVSN